MNKKGFSRPGALQMLAAVALMICGGLAPVMIAASRPSHEWIIALSGAPALALSLAGVAIFILYVAGFLRYCASKGYSGWLGLLLLCGNVFGFIVLLLLPDVNDRNATSGKVDEQLPDMADRKKSA